MPVIFDVYDACDKCGAKPKVRAFSAVSGNSLDLCGHHYDASAVKLARLGFTIERAPQLVGA